MCMHVVFCKIDHCIHIHWCIVMGLGHNDPWVESHMWPQQTWGQRSSRGQWPLVQVFGKKGQCIHILWSVFSNLILQWLQKYVIAKSGETRGSRTALLNLSLAIYTRSGLSSFLISVMQVWITDLNIVWTCLWRKLRNDPQSNFPLACKIDSWKLYMLFPNLYVGLIDIVICWSYILFFIVDPQKNGNSTLEDIRKSTGPQVQRSNLELKRSVPCLKCKHPASLDRYGIDLNIDIQCTGLSSGLAQGSYMFVYKRDI